MRGWIGRAAVASLCALAFLSLPAVTRADLVFEDASISLAKPSGGTQHLAGAHPDLRFSFQLPSGSAESIHDVVLDLPPGLVASATAVPPCPPDEFFVPDNAYLSLCPEESRVGTVELWRPDVGEAIEVPLFSLAHGPDVPVRFGFLYGLIPVFLEPHFRAEDYGISVRAGISQVEPLAAAEITIWGVPGDPVHGSGSPAPDPTAAPKPLLRNPTSCEGAPARFAVRGDSWEHRGIFDEVPLSGEDDGTPFAFEGCAGVPFAPTLSAALGSSAADSPTGLDLDVRLSQITSPSGQVSADLRRAVIALPAGLTLSAAAAAGLGACAPAQVRLGSDDPPRCPDSSRIGTASIRTPLLAERLDGAVYLARQGDNPFGSDLALYFVVAGPGFDLKLPARVDADPRTGQLTISFSNLPQLPFEELSLTLKDGPRALLQTPPACGTYAVAGQLVPWSGGEPVPARSTFAISAGCDAGFAPGLRAGTEKSTAGAASSFALQLTRRPGEQNLAAVGVTLPRGLAVRTAGVPLCGDAQAAAGDCPAASRIGRVTVGAGAGPTPLYLPEPGGEPTEAFLAGPYRGAPYSLVVELPAQAGPFELGLVSVRFAVHVDPVDARVSVRSDPLPQLLRGIPISYRDLRVELDRPRFFRNPTGCEAKRIHAAIRGADGAVAAPTTRFRATGCGRLAFDPGLSLRLTGPTHRGAHPGLRVLLRGRSGDANLAAATIALPSTEYLDNAHIRDVCSRQEYSEDACPRASIYGWASARSPLLDEPLRGPVYLRTSDRALPDLVAALDGPIELDLAARVDSVGSRLRVALRDLPDAPLSRLALTLRGGRDGLLVNNTELCRVRPRSRADLLAQNGRRLSAMPAVGIRCGGAPGARLRNKDVPHSRGSLAYTRLR